MDLEKTVDLVDEALSKQWHVNVIATQPTVSADVWLQRVFNKLLERDPEPTELQQFRSYILGSENELSRVESRIRVVDTILNDRQYEREFFNLWADRFQRHLLSGLPVRDQSVEFATLKSFLRKSFLEKKSLDAIAEELISASGSSDPQAVGYQAASSFLALASRGNATNVQDQLTSTLSRSFLGTRVSCAQCHDDSLYAQKRTDYHGLSSFFKGVRVDRKTGAPVVMERVRTEKNPGSFFEDRTGIAVYAPPRVAGIEIRMDQTNPRVQLGRFVTASDAFAMTMVNWVWKDLFGYGLAREGRIRSGVSSPHNPLLAKLGDQLRANDFDFRV